MPAPIGAEEVTPNANDNAQQNATDPLDHVGRGLQNGATLPFGGLQWDPNKIFWLYGAGCGRPDMLKIIPRATGEGGGAINIAQEKQGTPGYWRGVVGGWRDPAIIVEQTVSYRSGIARYLFNPALESGYIWIQVTQGNRVDAPVGEITLPKKGDTSVQGVTWQAQFCEHGQAPVHLFFDMEFDRPFAAADFVNAGKNDNEKWLRLTFDLKDAKLPEREAVATRQRDTDAGAKKRILLGKLGISWTSAENAQLNRETELPHWDFDKVHTDATDIWRKHLLALTIEESPDWMKDHVYGRLYTTSLHPNLFSDVTGEFVGFDGKTRKVRDPDHKVFHTFSRWDTYRTHMPMVSLLWPEVASDLAQTLIYQAETGGGGYARWSIGYAETGTMEGDPGTTMIATAYSYGARDFEADRALEQMVKIATTPGIESSPNFETRPGLAAYLKNGNLERASKSQGGKGPGFSKYSTMLKYAVSDFALSRMAEQMGKNDLADYFEKQSNNWKGMRSEKWKMLTQPGKTPYESLGNEGYSFQYTWLVPHNQKGLAEAMGGREAAIWKLEQHLQPWMASVKKVEGDAMEKLPEERKIWVEPNPERYRRTQKIMGIWNEHAFLTPMLFNWLGQPWKTQEAARGTWMKGFARKLDDGQWKQERPGQMDLGAGDTWNVWLMLGIYPAILGEPGLAIGSLLLPEVSFPLGGTGRHVTLIAHDAKPENAYIQRMMVNGKSWTSSWLPFNALNQNENTIEFWMGDTPNKEWGAAEKDLPPSFDTEPGYQANPKHVPDATYGGE